MCLLYVCVCLSQCAYMIVFLLNMQKERRRLLYVPEAPRGTLVPLAHAPTTVEETTAPLSESDLLLLAIHELANGAAQEPPSGRVCLSPLA